MVSIPQKTAAPLRAGNLQTLNSRPAPPLNRDTVMGLNALPVTGSAAARNSAPRQAPPAAPAQRGVKSVSPPVPDRRAAPPPPARNPAPPDLRPLPKLLRPLQRGQKTAVCGVGEGRSIRVCVGWNVLDRRCDIDVSAFLLNAQRRVPGDEWFVFYGQRQSPDGGVIFRETASGGDRESIEIHFRNISPGIEGIVFVLTIHEALKQGLHFGMVSQPYVRLLNERGGEMMSYELKETYRTVTSMTIGELYRHSGQWKFNPVGNGLKQDLAGQCAVYGVQLA